LEKPCNKYELEMIERNREAVLLSRIACVHATQFHEINGQSPLVCRTDQARRAVLHNYEHEQLSIPCGS